MEFGLQHTGIYCRNIDESLAFYTKKLGFKHLFSSSAMEGDKPLKMAWIKGFGDVVVELIEQDDTSWFDGMGSCLNHLAVRVDDMDAFVDMLNKNEVKIEAGPFDPPLEFDRPLDEEDRELFTVCGDKGTQLRILFFRGPDQERFEIMQDCIKAF